MYDRRVARGSTYAPSKRTQPMPSGPFRPIPVAGPKTPQRHTQAHQQQNSHLKEHQHPLPPSSAAPADQYDVDFMRVATPEPVAGRCHMTIQTDTYLEDLRRNKHTQEHDFATQTDPENDRPTQPLFIPRSSGDDVSTEIDADALFDFDLEVQSILNVLLEKTLEQSLMEVCEEEELKELAAHQSTFQQEKNAQLVAVQQIVQRDERRKAERQRRQQQEQDRLADEARTAEKRLAATAAKRFVEAMEENILIRLEEEGYFYDPVRKEVETVFMPQLMQQTTDKLAAYAQATELLDGVLADTIGAYRERVAAASDAADELHVERLIRHKLEPALHPRPTSPILSSVARVGSSEECSSRSSVHGRTSRLARAAIADARPTPDERSQKVVDQIRAERAAVIAAEAKRLHDITLIQSLQRGKRDRARVAKLLEARRREAERAAMSPQELLVSLRSYLGLQVKLLESTAESESESSSASSASSSSSPSILISSIVPRLSASQAGLVLNDRLIAINGTPVTDVECISNTHLKSLGINPGDIIQLQVERRTTDRRIDTIALEVTTDEDGYDHPSIRQLRIDGDLPENELPWLDRTAAEEMLAKLPGKLGATVGEIKSGARLTKVTPDSAAARAGLKEGDVIVKIDGEPVADHKAFTASCKELQAGAVVELDILSPASLDKVQSGGAINLRTMTTTKVPVEMGGGGKKYSIEGVRGLRRIAGLDVFGEQ